MITQADKGISSIAYNFLNLPAQVVQHGVTTQYIYRADGTKLKKSYGTGKVTDYLDGFQYEIENGEVKLQFVPTSEGYYDFKKNLYIYNYVDHLGNVRLSYTKNSGGVLEILEESNYYPFGLKHSGYNNITSATPSYQYKYNGKELQETGMYDYGARFYMPDIGRWGVVDNKTEKYYPMSPYNYAINNPINVIDPDGNDIYILIWFSTSKGGGETGHAGIAVDNYKEQEKKDEKGNTIIGENGKPETEWVKDGTYTYYDLWPYDSVSNNHVQDDVNPGYTEGRIINSLDDLKNTDVTTQHKGNVLPEGRSADGIVKLPGDEKDSKSIISFAENQIKNNIKYNGSENNCSTFTQNSVNNTGKYQIDASQPIIPVGILRLFGYKKTNSVAPNNLYNAALKIKGAENIKGPNSIDAKPYLEYFGKRNGKSK